MAEDDGDRTFDPTPKRREQFKKDGRIPRARDAASVAGAFMAIGALVGTADAIRVAGALLFSRTIGDVSALTRGEASQAVEVSVGALVAFCVPILIASIVGVVIIGTAQTGLSMDLAHVSFKWDRLDPISKLKQMFSPRHAGTELALAVLKVVVVMGVAAYAIRAESDVLLGLVRVPFPESARALAGAILRVTLKTLAAGAGIAAVDYAQSWFKISSDMKMTLKELKEDMRSEDGDPRVKGRMKARARAAAKRRMMQDVKQAAVIVTNPTHISVALRYGGNDPAPTVVAKGHDEVALAIRREARKHGIPIIENRPLARTLDAQVAIGKPVKIEHFAAVAKILAFVYQARRRSKVGTRGALKGS